MTGCRLLIYAVQVTLDVPNAGGVVGCYVFGYVISCMDFLYYSLVLSYLHFLFTCSSFGKLML